VKKFLVVGVGGSGGATLRYLMDQLRADLGAHDIDSMPAAWQFLQVDVNPEPEVTVGLGSIRDLGGRYVSVSTPSNAYDLVRRRVVEALQTKSSLDTLLGWTPTPAHEASGVNVISGAGQFRAVGRMLTLTSLDKIQKALNEAWSAMQAPTAWDELPGKWASEGPYANDGQVVPIVVGSLAGGSGASMFLDVCRLLGRIDGIRRSGLGVFLYSPDVFHSLDPSIRTGIDGNAMGALGDLVAAQTRAGDEADNRIFEALGLPAETVDDPAFGRVFPVGSYIGGDGARFGADTDDIYRGLGRALAATIGSNQAANQYVKSKIENPTPPPTRTEIFGWGSDPAVFSWGSFGYASLSLGRDRYGEYAAQRLARNAVDRLLEGFLNRSNQLPSTEQLNQLVDSQWGTILSRLGLPPTGTSGKAWMESGPLPEAKQSSEGRKAAAGAVQALHGIEARPAGDWLAAVKTVLPLHQTGAAETIRQSSYRWAAAFATTQEERTLAEFLRMVAHPSQGLPYARAVVQRLRRDVSALVETLRKAPDMSAQPLALDTASRDLASALGKTVVDAGHDLAQQVATELAASARRELLRESARLGAEVLASYGENVLEALERAASHAIENLEAARQATAGEAGIAQLQTTIYREWPEESLVVPPRFDHAQNEVLLTTSAQFPDRFHNHVSAASKDGVYASMLSTMLREIVMGEWQNTGGAPSKHTVLSVRSKWRPAALPRDPDTQEPTPPNQPDYHLALSTTDVLERARAYTARKDQPFEQFSTQTFEGYLNEPGITDAERSARLSTFVQRFEETIKQARPLVGVSRSMVEALHPGVGFKVELSFNAIPLTANSPAAVELRAMLDKDDELESSSVTRFEQSLSTSADSSRITVFGSYPKYSPLVFNSFMDQLQKRWSSSSDAAQRGLWKWKRTRPLTAALAMSPAEFRTLIRGWYIGRALGLVVQPLSTTSDEPVQVFDFELKDWQAFQARQLTPRDRYRNQNGFDWLPGILEGHTLALVNSTGDTAFTSLLPYRALRSIADKAPEPTPEGVDTHGARLLADWLLTGAWPSGVPSQISEIADAGPDITGRADTLRRWLLKVAEWVESNYLSSGNGVGVLSKHRLRVDAPQQLESLPLFAEIALSTYDVLIDLAKNVDRALAIAGQGGDGLAPQV